MTTRLLLFAIVIPLLSVLSPGCAQSSPHGPGPEPRTPAQRQGGADSVDAEIFLTGLVLREFADLEDFPISLTSQGGEGAPFKPHVAIRFQHDVKLHVRQPAGTPHDYEVLLGPDPERDVYAEGQVNTSEATTGVKIGWIIVTGHYPLAESEWVSTSSPGTSWAIRVADHPDPARVRHYVYNLEQPGSGINVFATLKSSGAETELPPDRYLVVLPESTKFADPRRIQPGDPFVAMLHARAALAGLELNGGDKQK